MYADLHAKCLLFLSRINQNRDFSSNFSKSLKYETLGKASSCGGLVVLCAVTGGGSWSAQSL